MKRFLTQVATLAAIAAAGTFGAVLVGLLAYGTNVFEPQSPGFLFVSYGFSGALIFAFCHVRGLSEAITAAVVVSAAQFAVGSASITLLRALVFSFGLNIPVIALAFVFERTLARHRRLRFVVVGLTYGGMFVFLTLLTDLLAGPAGIPAAVFRENFVDGLLLGIGLALGVDGGEALTGSPAPSVRRET
jgi:hypothetical protein